jgi:hypothetical protein
MGKTINFTIDGKDYTLEFTRNTVIDTERMGFSLNKIGDQPVGMTEILWKGAFLAHHDTLTIGEVEALYEKIDKHGLLDALIELYRAPIESLFEEDEGNSKNVVKWTIN